MTHVDWVGVKIECRSGAKRISSHLVGSHGLFWHGADAVAAMMARIHPDNGADSWQAVEMAKLRSAMDAFAPGVREEMSAPGKARTEWVRRPSTGLLQRVVRVHADGPTLKAHLSVYGCKLAMSLFREHVGVALPLDGAVWCQFPLNAGMTQQMLNERCKTSWL